MMHVMYENLFIYCMYVCIYMLSEQEFSQFKPITAVFAVVVVPCTGKIIKKDSYFLIEQKICY